MSIEADKARWKFGNTLSDIPQEQRVYYVRQLLIDLMDYTEQSDDENLWCRLNEELERLYPNYAKYEELRNETK